MTAQSAESATIPNFIFRDEDFSIDKDEFDAAAFVTRFRRVTPLESLREQLMAYSNHVRKQLYVIINRDYKDFISIATNLDGLDTRLLMIQRPLLDLRIDLSSLHNGTTASLHAIQGKLHQRKEIASRKQSLQQILRCMDELTAAQAALQSSDSAPSQATNRNHLHRSLDRLRSLDEKSGVAASIVEADVFACSEFERAAASLHCVAAQLASLSTSLPNTASTKPATGGAPSSLTNLRKTLGDQLAQATLTLREKLSSHVERFFTAAATTEAPPTSPSHDVSAILYEHRGLAHCLRALVALRQGSLAEELLSAQIITPQLKQLLAPGRVDGKEGKGSFSGFGDCLQALLSFLSTHKLLHCLVLAEHVHMPHSQLDLVVNGVLSPLFNYLQDKFPSIFSIGIASIFSLCYRALQDFLHALASLIHPTAGAHACNLLLHRIRTHERVTSFFQQFKLDTYFQLRSREVMLRCDKVCEGHVRQILHPSTARLLEQVYPAIASSSSSSSSRAGRAQAESSLASRSGASGGGGLAPQSLSSEDYQQLAALGPRFHFDVFTAVRIEVLTLLHPHVTLLPVYTKAVGLIQRVLLRLALHTSLYLNVSIPSLFASKAELDSMRAAYFDLSTHAPVLSPAAPATPSAHTVAGPGSVSKAGTASAARPTTASQPPETPVKATPAKAGIAATPGGSTASSGAAGGVQVSVDQAVRAAGDALRLLAFLHGEQVAVFVRTTSCLAEGVEQAGDDENSGKIVPAGLWPSPRRHAWPGEDALAALCVAAWRHITTNVTNDCKKALANVKAIAAKYLMTAKPAPSQPTPYVESIFSPLRALLTEFSTSLGGLALAAHVLSAATTQDESTSSPSSWLPAPNTKEEADALLAWKAEVCEAVVVAMAAQVSLLFEDVKAKTSTLRRGKVATASDKQSGELRDADKVALQVQLDVRALGEDLVQLGIVKEKTASQSAAQEYDKLRGEVDAIVSQQLSHKNV